MFKTLMNGKDRLRDRITWCVKYAELVGRASPVILGPMALLQRPTTSFTRATDFGQRVVKIIKKRLPRELNLLSRQQGGRKS
jgi:hypothetical protein